MHTHMPSGYICPFCKVARGQHDGILTGACEVFYRDDMVTGFISAHFWKSNPGHALVIPNEPFGNIFSFPDEYALSVHRLARQIAIAMKLTYNCDGISTRQHNEPAGSQDVWHYHLHVFPRYENDKFYSCKKYYLASETEKKVYADRLKNYFDNEVENGLQKP